MNEVRTAHTAELEPSSLDAARALMFDVFDEMTEIDWDHIIGGVHALVWEGDELIAHGCVVQRMLMHEGSVLRTGYVEGIAVRADRRGRGHGASVMTVLERVVRRAYQLGALSSTDDAVDFYAARGWTRWMGPTSVLTPSGIIRTEADDGSVYVLPLTVPLNITGDITCDWRDGDVW